MTELKGHLFEQTPPTPPAKPVVGHALEFRHDILATLYAGWRSHGDLVQYQLGSRPIYVVSTPELVQEILVTRRDTFSKHHVRSEKPNGLKIILGNGLLTNTIEESWLIQRRMMQPMFHRKQIMTMGDKIVAAGQRLLERWERRYEPEQVVDVSAEMTRVTLDVINQTMFSADVLDHAEIIGHAVADATEYIFQRMFSPVKLPLSWPTPGQRRLTHAMQQIDTLLYQLIAERRSSSDHPGDLLDMLLEAEDAETGERMNDAQVRDEVATIFGAGHDTTAHTLTWAWYLLAQHPSVQAELEAELDTILNGRTPTLDDLPQLDLTRRIFEETLRLYPAAPILIRLAAHDTLLGDFDIPQAAEVMISIYNIHRHPDYWEAPETFDPDRFTEQRSAGRQRHAFMPFGAGPRMCIGNHFAQLEGMLLLATIAQKYRFQTTTTVQPEVAITLRPQGGMPLKLVPRS